MQTQHFALNISANGVPLSLRNIVVQRVVLFSSKYQIVPTGELVLSDPKGEIASGVSLTDGTPITISLGKTANSQVQYNFRIFKVGKVQGVSGLTYRLILYWDNPLYWKGTATLPVTGSSGAVIQSIASDCGLNVYVDPTADSMVWLPMRRTYSAWAYSVAHHAYYNDQSAFALALRLDNGLVMRNIAGLTYTDSSIPTFVSGLSTGGQSGRIPIQSFKSGVASGFKNMRGGYHLQMQEQTAVETTETQTYTTVAKVQATQQFNLNQSIKDTLANAPLLHQAPISCGNTHPFYIQAAYQNGRVDKLFSSVLELLTKEQAGIDVLDRCITQVYTMPVSGDTAQLDLNHSGNYHVAGKVVYADVTGVYAEKYILATDGHNTDPGNARSDV